MSALYIIVSIACLAIGGYMILVQLKIIGGPQQQDAKPDLNIKGLIIGVVFVIVGFLLFAL